MKEEAETVYQLWQKFYIQDADKKKEGIDLDEFEVKLNLINPIFSSFCVLD